MHSSQLKNETESKMRILFHESLDYSGLFQGEAALQHNHARYVQFVEQFYEGSCRVWRDDLSRFS